MRTNLPRTIRAVLAAGLMLLAAQAGALEPVGTDPAPPRPVATAVAPFTPWQDAADLRQRQEAANRGQECPGGSGSYCTDRFPVCCSSGGSYSCQASRADCR